MSTYRKKVKACDLKLADVIQTGAWEYCTATVHRVTDGYVHLIRPYIHTADFSCTSGVITYIGFEQYSIHRNDNEYYVHSRKELK